MFFDNYKDIRALGLQVGNSETFHAADLIVEAREWTDSGPGRSFYLVVEASFTGTSRDVQKVSDHAAIVRMVTDIDVYATVSAVRMAPDAEGLVMKNAREYMESGSEDGVYWYRLTERLEPDEPD